MSNHKKNNVELIHSWATPIAILQLDENLANRIESIIVPQVKSLPVFKNLCATDYHVRKQEDENGDLTAIKNQGICIEELIPEFCVKLQSYVQKYSEYSGIHYDKDRIPNFWTQDYVEHSIHPLHNHGLNGISGTYYVRANKQAGPIKFKNPNTMLDYVRLNDKKMHSDVIVYPEKGKLILFPSYLKHEVVASNANAIRTSISFNY